MSVAILQTRKLRLREVSGLPKASVVCLAHGRRL